MSIHVPTKEDYTVMRQLIGQVSRAAGKDAETKVVTYITRPMWRAWCRALGDSEDSEPTEWQGALTKRVYGSKTIVVDREGFASFSYKP